MTTSSDSLRRCLSALGAVLLASTAAFGQATVGDLGAAAGEQPIERNWALNVHVIGISFLDVTGDVDATAIDGTDARLNGWGVEGSTLGDRFTFLVGFEERTLEKEVNFLEVYGGSKYNFEQRGPWAPYLIGTIRYSQDLRFPTDPETSSEDFFGWSAGGGVAYHWTDRFFLEGRIVYEGLFSTIDARMGRDLAFRGPVATFGAGFTF